jgi:hypothetical protein
MKYAFAAALGLLVSACTPVTTSSIDVARVESPIRQSCPAFRQGSFAPDAARTYGTEQITNFQNGSRFTCRCVVRDASSAPSCAQVTKFGPIRIEP